MKFQFSKESMFALVLVVLAIFSRLIPHPWNGTALIAAVAFAGSRLPSRLAMIVAFSSLVISDLILGWHSTVLFSYLAMALIIGFVKLAKAQSSKGMIFSSIVASMIFFLVSNFGVWLIDGMYAFNLSGLMNSYIMGIPFLKNQLISDVVFMGILLSLEQVFKHSNQLAVEKNK